MRAEYEERVRGIYGDLADRYLALYPATDIKESALAAARDAFYGWSAERLARAQTKLGQPAFLYFFDHEYPAAVARNLAAFHGSELPYEFGLIGSAVASAPQLAAAARLMRGNARSRERS